MIAVREEFLKTNRDDVKTILNIINKTTLEFKDIPSIDKTIANRYNQKLEDVQEWLSLTEWSQENINKKTLDTVQKKLLKLNIIPKMVAYDKLVEDV